MAPTENPIQLELKSWKADIYRLRHHEWEIHLHNCRMGVWTYQFLGNQDQAEGFATGLMVGRSTAKEKTK